MILRLTAAKGVAKLTPVKVKTKRAMREKLCESCIVKVRVSKLVSMRRSS